jgi:VIT1/CCC1 family predicted Fe2+/Mn2+ transporter
LYRSKEASITFLSFIVIGFIPLFPFLFGDIPLSLRFKISIMVTSLTFFFIGLIRGYVLQYKVLESGILTFVTGGGAATLAFLVGHLIGK